MSANKAKKRKEVINSRFSFRILFGLLSLRSSALTISRMWRKDEAMTLLRIWNLPMQEVMYSENCGPVCPPGRDAQQNRRVLQDAHRAAVQYCDFAASGDAASFVHFDPSRIIEKGDDGDTYPKLRMTTLNRIVKYQLVKKSM